MTGRQASLAIAAPGVPHLGDGGGERGRGEGAYGGPVLMLDTMAPGYTLVSQADPLLSPAVKFSACPDQPAAR